MVILGRGLDGLNLGTNSLIVGVGGLLDELLVGTTGQVLTINPTGDIAWVTGSVSGLQNVVEDTTPQLGAALDAQTFQIVNLADPILNQDAATKIYVDSAISSSSIASINDLGDVDTTGLITGDALIYNGISGNWEPQVIASGSGGINNVVEDLTPQLGGTLDAQGAFTVSNLIDPILNQDAATKIYVDTAVSDLVASAPATLDTLNELAAALGNDANFAITVTTSIGEKVAKAGDTMTGALVLSGNPTLALHAATKQYVDGIVGETNTMANIVGGVGVYKQKIGVNFEMHPITGAGGTTVSLIGDVITVNSTSGTVTNIVTGDGISGGPITGTGTVALDINGLSVAAAVDKANDTIAIYDNDVGGVRKVVLSSLGVGDLVAVNNLSELTATQVTARSNIGAASAADLTSHTGDTNNPHSVTAAQTGAVAKIGDTMTGPLVFDTGASLISATGIDLNIIADTTQKVNIEGGNVEVQGGNGTGGQLLLNSDGSIQLRPAIGFDLTLGDNIIMPFSIGTVGQILQVNAGGTAMEYVTNGAGVTTLVALDDTTISAPASGNVLRHDGTDWKNAVLGYTDLSGLPTLGTAAANNTGDFATAAQGSLADSALQNIVEDLSPQLGANLDVQGFNIGTAAVNGDIAIIPNGTGSLVIGASSGGIITSADAAVSSNAAGENLTITGGNGDGIGGGGNILLTPGTGASNGTLVLDGLIWPSIDGTVGQIITTDGSGNLSFTTVSGGAGDPNQNLWETIIADTGSTIANTITDTLTVSGGTDITTSITGDILTVAYSGVGQANQNAFASFVISGNTAGDLTMVADGPSDTITFIGGANITLTGNATGDTITVDASGGAFTQNIWETIASDSGTTIANTSTDTLFIAGGAGVSTSVTGDTLTITNDLPNVDQSLWDTFISDSGSATATGTTDNLIVTGGTGISTAVVGSTLTITNTAPAGSQSTFLTFTADGPTSTSANTATDVLTVSGGTGVTTNIIGDILTITNDSPNVDQNLFSTIIADGPTSTTANTVTDSLTIAGGTGITTTVAGDILTITNTGTAPNLWETFISDSGSVAANTSTDTFTVVGGTGISTAIAGDTLTITNNTPNIVQNIWETFVADGPTQTTTNNATDIFTVSGGTGISTSITADTLTITNNSPNVDQNLWATVAGDAGSTAANTTADTITIAGAGAISTAVVGDVITITTTALQNITTESILSLSDTPATIGTVGQVLAVNVGATALEFVNQSGGGGGGTANEESFKLDYSASGLALTTTSNLSAGVASAVVSGSDVIITFTGHAKPPSSILLYGYAHTANEYNIRVVDANVTTRKIAAGGTSGAPTAFGAFAGPMTLTLTASITGASQGFGTGSHSWITFVFGD